MTKKQSWLQLLSIQAGGALCLPMILIGQMLCQKYGWFAGALILGGGNLFLLLIGLAFAALSTSRPQSTVLHAIRTFGNRGRLGLGLMMTLCMLGWFAVQLNVMTLSLEPLFGAMGFSVSPLLINISLGVLLSSAMCFGMKTLRWLSNLSAPLLGLTLLYTLFATAGALPAAPALTATALGGLSLIIGGSIASVIDLPTFFQHARSKKDAMIAVILLYGLVVPFIEGMGLYLSAITGGTSIIEVLQGGHGFASMLWISCFILLCGWTTNNANLYSATASSYALGDKGSYKTRILMLGGVATLIACFNPLGNLEIVLDLFGVAIGSMGAVILTDYLLETRGMIAQKNSSFVSYLFGMGSGLTALFLHFSVTGVAVFDAFLSAALLQTGLVMMNNRKRNYETVDSERP